MISSSANLMPVLRRLYKAYQFVKGLRVVSVQSSTPYTNEPPPPAVKEVVVVKLAEHSLTALEKRFPPPMIGNEPNDPLYVGQMLGVQRVLKELRDGWRV